MTKVCTKCGEEKNVDCFGIRKSTPDGFSIWCKQCKAYADKKYYQRNKDRIAKYKTKWWHENKGKVRVRFRKWYEDNRQEINKKQVDKRKQDQQLRVKHNLRTRIGKALYGNGAKSERTVELIGCDMAFFIKHIESLFQDGMTWSNYGKTGWHIDHTKPCAAFDLTKPNEQRECFHYSNMQPLWAEDNFRKGRDDLSQTD